MAKTLQLRRGTTAEITANTPASGELFVDTEKKTVTVGDGSTAGGIILARNDRVSDVYNAANGAASLAQAAFNQANTGGGGGANTGNYTFSANTISLPDFSDASMNLVGLTTRSVPIYNYTGIPVGSGSGEGYTFPPTGNFELNSSLEWISTYGVQLSLGTFESPSFSQALYDSVPNWNIGDTFDFVYAVGESSPYTLKSITLTLTSKPVEYNPGVNPYVKYWRFDVDKVIPADRAQTFNPNSVAINNYPYKNNSTYTFKGSGEFISDSALIGDVLITDDIITPLAFDSYGVVDSTTSGTLTVNGDLDVIGQLAANGNTTFISSNTVFYKVQYNAMGSPGNTLENIGLGFRALQKLPATLSDTFTHSNIGIGTNAGQNLSSFSQGNTLIGNRTLIFATSTSSTTCVGSQAGRSATDSASNLTALGYAAGFNSGGQDHTMIGASAGVSGGSPYTGTNLTCLGAGANPSSTTVSNEITLGNSSVTTLRCQVTSITSLSDARDKKDITTLNAGLNFVSKLKPVSFTWNMRDGAKVDTPDTGFIAQDLKQAQEETGITIPGLVYESNPEKLEAAYGKLIPVLVKAIQDLQAEVEALKSQK